MLHYDVHDGGEGPYLLLVHGFLSSRVQWTVNLAGLMAFCRPVVVELWGHGRSPTPDDPAAYSTAGYAACFEQIRAAVGAETWFVCGQSFGAGITLNYGLTHPDRITAQVFTNSISALTPPDFESEAARAMRRQVDRIACEGLEAIRALPFHPRRARRFPEDIYLAMNQDADAVDPAAVALSIRETFPGLSITERLQEIRVPTLLVNGKWEAQFQPLRHRAEEAMPALDIVDLEGGHSINIEAPDGFNAAVKAHLSRFSSRDPSA
ncbi:MAG: alpha/beta fold hydrolase [Alphaproteobacteria bacterium]